MTMAEEDTRTYYHGKGIMMDCTEETLDFLHGALEDLWNAAGEEGELNTLIDEGRQLEFLRYIQGSAQGWRSEKDDFGTKMYKELQWSQQANGTYRRYRITAVLTKRGELKIDFREMYSPR